MPFGTARPRLIKMLLFSLVQQVGQDICFQCDKQIKDIKNLSIDHKIPWLNSGKPKELFWDLNNIAYSHTSCNALAGASVGKEGGAKPEKRKVVCPICEQTRIVHRSMSDGILRGDYTGKCNKCKYKK